MFLPPHDNHFNSFPRIISNNSPNVVKSSPPQSIFFSGQSEARPPPPPGGRLLYSEEKSRFTAPISLKLSDTGAEKIFICNIILTMSLDSLFQQILLTEHQLTEQTQKLKDVKVEIIRQHERIKSETEKYKQTTEELDKKGQQLSMMTLHRDMMRKCEEQMLKQIEERLRQQNHLRDHLAKIKQQSKEDEQQFLEEMMKFNSDFSLPENREAVFESQTHAEILALQRDAEALHKEMDEMKRSNIHMSSTLEEKRQLLLDLQDLENIQKDLDRQMQEAQATTAYLREESRDVSQKHLTDSTCLNLRKELETLKDGDLGEQRQALRSEVEFLQSKLKSSQDSEQQC